MTLAYLHGFASGPGSTKGQFFRARFAEVGVDLALPDLTPDFTRQTITTMLAVIEPLLAHGPTILLGSSLGGYLATLAAARTPERVAGLVLFAPAFGFADLWQARIGAAAVARWRAAGTMPAFHYGRGHELPLDIGLLDDAATYPAEPDPHCPILVFAGRHDDAVPLETVAHFAAARSEREFVVLDAGHEMTEVLEPMWTRTFDFVRALGACS